jgi:hypothetical protein
MTLPESQCARCLAVLDKIATRTISRMFSQPVDPIRDNIPNYFQLVHTPMDLTTVREKLLANEYASVSAWRDDVELIWANSLAVNAKATILGQITIELQTLFRKWSQHLTDNPDADWVATLCALRDELSSVSRAAIKKDAGKQSPLKTGDKPKSHKKHEPPRPELTLPKLPP